MKIRLGLGTFLSLRDVATRVEELASSIAAGWNVAHRPDGRHTFTWSTLLATDVSFMGSGLMTWTVPASSVRGLTAVDLGRTLLLNGYLYQTSVAGTLDAQLRILLPWGLTVDAYTTGTFVTIDNGVVRESGIWTATPGTSFVAFFRDTAGANWSAATANTSLWFSVQVSVR